MATHISESAGVPAETLLATRAATHSTRETLLQTTNLFLAEDLEDARKTGELTQGDRDALRAVADWTKTFVVRPHSDLGRAGPVCPFVPVALDHKTLWFAAERSAGRNPPDVIQLIEGYKRLLLAAQPVEGDDASYKSIVVVFTDLPAAQAKDFFGGALQQIGVASYANDGLVMGPFYEGNDGAAAAGRSPALRIRVIIRRKLAAN
jgi:hypothetical protein